MNQWFILGFTPDDVVGGWQDARLASECMRALDAAGKPREFQILQSSGDDKYLFVWFVNEVAARVLDAHGVSWRNFLIGQATAPPPGARSPFQDTARSGR